MEHETITILLSQFNHMYEELEELREYKRNAEQQKEKTGTWIYDEQSKVYRCSCCNHFPWRVKCEKHDEIFTDLTRTNAYKHCPTCGIKMIMPQ